MTSAAGAPAARPRRGRRPHPDGRACGGVRTAPRGRSGHGSRVDTSRLDGSRPARPPGSGRPGRTRSRRPAASTRPSATRRCRCGPCPGGWRGRPLGSGPVRSGRRPVRPGTRPWPPTAARRAAAASGRHRPRHPVPERRHLPGGTEPVAELHAEAGVVDGPGRLGVGEHPPAVQGRPPAVHALGHVGHHQVGVEMGIEGPAGPVDELAGHQPGGRQQGDLSGPGAADSEPRPAGGSRRPRPRRRGGRRPTSAAISPGPAGGAGSPTSVRRR